MSVSRKLVSLLVVLVMLLGVALPIAAEDGAVRPAPVSPYPSEPGVEAAGVFANGVSLGRSVLR